MDVTRMEKFWEFVLESIDSASQWLVSGGLRVLLIVILTFTALKILKWLGKRFLKKFEDPTATTDRIGTLNSILQVTARIVILALSFMLILGEFGIDLGPLLATAGVVGLAVGFGAQELVKDTINGFFILLEDQVRVGDVVELDGNAGVVEKINLRTITLRDISSTVYFIRHGNVSVIKNMTKDFSSYVFDISVSYDTDTDEAIEVVKNVAQELRSDPNFSPHIINDLEVFGLDQFADSALIIKARIKTRPLQQWSVGREFNRRLKKAFDQAGIEIPFPQRTLHYKPIPPGSE